MTKSDLLKYIDERLADPHSQGSVGLLMVRQYISDNMEEWIPVSERVPEAYINVFVTVKGHDVIMPKEGETLEQAFERISGTRWVTTGYVDDGGYWNYSDGFPMVVSPIAWMPFHEPWKGEEE